MLMFKKVYGNDTELRETGILEKKERDKESKL
jgi:hypothetical protein